MNRVAKVEQRIWPGQAIEQFALRNSDTTNALEIVHVVRGLLIEQAISTGEPMCAQLPLEIVDLSSILARIFARRQQLEPNRVEVQPAQTEHPLQRHRKIPAALAIFRCKAAPKENRHASRIAILLACSSSKDPNLRRCLCASDALHQ